MRPAAERQLRAFGGPDDFAIGMEVQIDLETLRTDDEGNEVVIYRFRPARDAPGASRSGGGARS